jgi:hypothetical protein
MTGTLHPQVMLRDPFTGHEVGIDEALVPVIERLWAAGIETMGSCQGCPGITLAQIGFAEPKGLESAPDEWLDEHGYFDFDEDDPGAVAELDRVYAEWDASRPDGARQVVAILVAGPWAHMTARWTWVFGDDEDDPNPGSALFLPTSELPVLAEALGAQWPVSVVERKMVP